jgi:hypothetical protein
MRYIFRPEEDSNFVGSILNSPAKVAERNGEYLLPFPSLVSPKVRAYEQYGYLLQEQDRLKNLNWIQKDLETFLEKWRRFHDDKIFHTLYRDKKGNPSFENVWNGFLDYAGKKDKYRMRKKKSNREVLQNQLKIKVDWKKEDVEEFPRVKIEKKLQSILDVIASTRINVAEAETALNDILELLYKEIEEESNDSTDVQQIFNSLVQDVKARAKEALEGATSSSKKPSEES